MFFLYWSNVSIPYHFKEGYPHRDVKEEIYWILLSNTGFKPLYDYRTEVSLFKQYRGLTLPGRYRGEPG